MCDRIYVGFDPGTYESGVCIFDSEEKRVLDAFHEKNVLIPARLKQTCSEWMIPGFTATFEKMRKYQVGAGESVFQACVWHGRFIQYVQQNFTHVPCFSVSSPEVKFCLLGTTRGVTKTAVKHALIELFPKTGGGKTPEIGTKKEPGPLFAMKRAKGYHHWDALATSVVVLAWQKKRFEGEVIEEPPIESLPQ